MFFICNHLGARMKMAFEKSSGFYTHFAFSNTPCCSTKLLRDINSIFRDCKGLKEMFSHKQHLIYMFRVFLTVFKQ